MTPHSPGSPGRGATETYLPRGDLPGGDLIAGASTRIAPMLVLDGCLSATTMGSVRIFVTIPRVKWKREARESVMATSVGKIKKPSPNLQLSHCFSAYGKYFNKRFTRHGGLFERRFERKKVEGNDYLKHAIVYIHSNPVHHHFCSHARDYPWSSYHSGSPVFPLLFRKRLL